MFLCKALVVLLAAGATASEHLLKDIDKISRYWGQVAYYVDNDEDYFGVNHVGMPDGCQIESVSTLQRHAERFPIGYNEDGINDVRFADKLSEFKSGNASRVFTGPLSFLNSYTYIMQTTGLLTGRGAATEFSSGVAFWNRYGRTLYNASVAQRYYNASFPDGTPRPKPVLRTTSQARIENSQINWALGFFGPTLTSVVNPTLMNWTDSFEVVVITEGGSENNTLTSYDSCLNDYDATVGYLGDNDVFKYIPLYLGAATARLQKYAPAGFILNVNDTYAMQSICSYEYGYIGMSSFCGLFTADEWAGFENTLDIECKKVTFDIAREAEANLSDYYDYAYGNPTGRAQGIGYLQELLARLQNQYITSSNSSVNSTIDNNSNTFPLGQPFYADFSHDDIIISVLTAMSVDYFRDPPSLTQYPPNPNRHFVLSHLTPFGARLITETIGCASANPKAVRDSRVAYTPGQYGYNPANAPYKFVRMRLNNGIVPLNTIRGGACGNATSGRTDGLCSLTSFVASQKDSYALSNYDYACFGNWTSSITDPTNGKDYDGTIFA